jgi:hypothetical protein
MVFRVLIACCCFQLNPKTAAGSRLGLHADAIAHPFDIVKEQSATNAKLVVCLDNNTKVLEQCRDELGRSRRRTTK